MCVWGGAKKRWYSQKSLGLLTERVHISIHARTAAPAKDRECTTHGSMVASTSLSQSGIRSSSMRDLRPQESPPLYGPSLYAARSPSLPYGRSWL